MSACAAEEAVCAEVAAQPRFRLLRRWLPLSPRRRFFAAFSHALSCRDFSPMATIAAFFHVFID